MRILKLLTVPLTLFLITSCNDNLKGTKQNSGSNTKIEQHVGSGRPQEKKQSFEKTILGEWNLLILGERGWDRTLIFYDFGPDKYTMKKNNGDVIEVFSYNIDGDKMTSSPTSPGTSYQSYYLLSFSGDTSIWHYIGPTGDYTIRLVRP